jgi:GNAT superfamily N-acetyltransferase
MNYIIRKADSSNSAVVQDFQVKMAMETEGLKLDREVLKSGVEAVFADKNKGQYYLAEHEGEIVGCLLITPEWSDWRTGWVWWIQSVFVVPAHRKRGVFKTMYTYLKNQVEKSDDLRGLRLYVEKNNLSAQKVYKAMGMTDDHYDLYEWFK